MISCAYDNSPILKRRCTQIFLIREFNSIVQVNYGVEHLNKWEHIHYLVNKVIKSAVQEGEQAVSRSDCMRGAASPTSAIAPVRDIGSLPGSGPTKCGGEAGPSYADTGRAQCQKASDRQQFACLRCDNRNRKGERHDLR